MLSHPLSVVIEMTCFEAGSRPRQGKVNKSLESHELDCGAEVYTASVNHLRSPKGAGFLFIMSTLSRKLLSIVEGGSEAKTSRSSFSFRKDVFLKIERYA